MTQARCMWSTMTKGGALMRIFIEKASAFATEGLPTLGLVLFLAAVSACTPAQMNNPVGIANPASTHCVKLGGKLEIRTTPRGEVGICHLPGGVICEEWSLFRGECPK